MLSLIRSWLLQSRGEEGSAVRRGSDRLSRDSRRTSCTSVEVDSGRCIIGPFLFKRRSTLVCLCSVVPRIAVISLRRFGSVHDWFHILGSQDDGSARPVGWYVPGRGKKSGQRLHCKSSR